MTTQDVRTQPEMRLLEALFAADSAGVQAVFAGDVVLDAPRIGTVSGAGEALERAVSGWPASFNVAAGVYVSPRFSTSDTNRCVVEATVAVSGPDGPFRLPIAVVGERTDGDLLASARIYHQVRGITGEESPRHNPFAGTDLRLAVADDFSGAVGQYFQSLIARDVDGVLAALDENVWIEGGRTRAESKENVRPLYQMLAGDGVMFNVGAITDDGTTVAFEWVFEEPGYSEAGLACYATGGDHITNIRMYDEIDVVAILEPNGFYWR